MVNAIAREETIRDLRSQLEGLSREDEQEVVFKDLSSAKGFTTLYRLLDGEPVRMSMELATMAIRKTVSGRPLWTTKQEEAPTWVEGKIPCFLHPDAPEKDVMMSLGLPPICEQGKLRNAQAKRVHAIHCHKDEWAAYQEYLSDERIRVENDQRARQLDATIALAGRAAGADPKPEPAPEPDPVPAVTLTCDCGWETVKGENSLAAHKRMHCPLREGA